MLIDEVAYIEPGANASDRAATGSDAEVPDRSTAPVSIGERLTLAKRLNVDGEDAALFALLEATAGLLTEPGPRIEFGLIRAQCPDAPWAVSTRVSRSIGRCRPDALAVGSGDARAQALVGMGFACIKVALPERALEFGMAAFRLALGGGHLRGASDALELVGICRAMGGEPTEAWQLFMEALGLALQLADDNVLQVRLTNLLHTAVLRFDASRSAGDDSQADTELLQCGRFVAHGDRLVQRAPVYAQLGWRLHRSAWLLRRGQVGEAVDDPRGGARRRRCARLDPAGPGRGARPGDRVAGARPRRRGCRGAEDARDAGSRQR